MFSYVLFCLKLADFTLDHPGFDLKWAINGGGVVVVTGVPALCIPISFTFLNNHHLACSYNSLLMTSVSGAVSSLLHGFRLMFP